jgi:hypothetical protein
VCKSLAALFLTYVSFAFSLSADTVGAWVDEEGEVVVVVLGLEGKRERT